MRKKAKKEGFGRGLDRVFTNFNRADKRDAAWFFGSIKQKNPYDMPMDYEGAADEFFGFKKKKAGIKVNV